MTLDTVLCAGWQCSSPRLHFGGANQLPVAPTFPALDKLWSHKSAGNMGKKRSKTMEHAHVIGCGLGEARQTSLMLARWAKSA